MGCVTGPFTTLRTIFKSHLCEERGTEIDREAVWALTEDITELCPERAVMSLISNILLVILFAGRKHKNIKHEHN